MDWIIANKTWLFDGALVAVPIAILGWIFAKRAISRSQKQRGGHGSINIQAGGNVKLETREPNDKAGPDQRG